MPKRLTIRDSEKLAELRGGRCLSKRYRSALSRMRWRCAKGHEWKATFSSVKYQGTWCPECARMRTVAGRRKNRVVVKRIVPKDDVSNIKMVHVNDEGQALLI